MADLVRQFHRAGGQRLEAGEVLYSEHGRVVDGLYLGGNCVECSLKAMVLTRIPIQRQRDYVTTEFRGKVAHNFDSLVDQWIKLGGSPIPRTILRGLRTGRLIWNSELCYEAGLGNLKDEDIQDFLTFARRFWVWVKEII